ncbi:MAG: hypothetical protein IR153_06250 [Flavobacterium sp.]|nr:hypothetical protein [Flavobacterium sp.]MBF0694641.1 hypothetical protein [Flavobacterium sp.]
MKATTLLGFILIANVLFAQKSEFTFDENEVQITQIEFKKKIETKQFLYTVYENDTALIGKIAKKEEFGTISKKERDEIIIALKLSTNSDFDDQKPIVINFFYKPTNAVKGTCIDHYTTDKKFKKQMKKNGVVQFFITEKNYTYANNTFEDASDQIRQKLFSHNFQCGNYIIIKPNGKFYRKVSEYNQDLILENLKRLE